MDKQKPTFIPAVVCFLVQGNEVLLMQRKKVSLGLGKNLISGVGGKVGDTEGSRNESAEEALVRELEEEIKVTPIKYDEAGVVRFVWQTKPDWNMEVTVYVVEEWDGIPKETEVARPEWYPISELPKNQMWEDNQHWVPKVLSGEKINATFYYDANKKISNYTFQ